MVSQGREGDLSDPEKLSETQKTLSGKEVSPSAVAYDCKDDDEEDAPGISDKECAPQAAQDPAQDDGFCQGGGPDRQQSRPNCMGPRKPGAGQWYKTTILDEFSAQNLSKTHSAPGLALQSLQSDDGSTASVVLKDQAAIASGHAFVELPIGSAWDAHGFLRRQLSCEIVQIAACSRASLVGAIGLLNNRHNYIDANRLYSKLNAAVAFPACSFICVHDDSNSIGSSTGLGSPQLVPTPGPDPSLVHDYCEHTFSRDLMQLPAAGPALRHVCEASHSAITQDNLHVVRQFPNLQISSESEQVQANHLISLQTARLAARPKGASVAASLHMT